MICLLKTKQRDEKIKEITSDLGYSNFVTVPPHGMSGGIAVLWKTSVSVSVLSLSANLVDTQVEFNGISFYLSVVYGHPNPSMRNEVWESLERISSSRSDPWLTLGDFNEIKNNEEKNGGPRRPNRSFEDFNRMITNCDVHDLKFIGNKFSWTGKRYSHNIWCCLDRTMANSDWMTLFPSAQTKFLDFEGSDHRPLVTNFCNTVDQRRNQFRYDSRLFHKEGFRDMILESWEADNTSMTLNSRIRQSRKQMAAWKRRNRLNASIRIAMLKRDLNDAYTYGNRSTEEIHEITLGLNQAYKDEEQFWKIKSRKNWVKLGDRNTKYFYGATKQRLARNRVLAVTDDAGNIYRGDDEIGEAAEEYFTNLFKSTRDEFRDNTSVFQGLQGKVTNQMNMDLQRMVNEEEIQKAVFDIGPDRAPGLDGITAAFYQQFWPDVKDAVIVEIQRFFREGNMRESMNHTNICLIP